MDDTAKIVDAIKFLVDQNEIIDSSKEIRQGHVWALKKLILLSKYLYPYLTILTYQESGRYKYGVDSWFFIDLCSGPGANELKEEKCKVIGSPIVSLLKGAHYIKKRKEYAKFTKWFFIEKNKECCAALEKRINATLKIINRDEEVIPKESVILCPGDCNKEIEQILQKIKTYKNPGILVFADPEGITEIEWSTFKKLFEFKYVDLIYVLSTSGIKRSLSKTDSNKYAPFLDADKNYDPEEITRKFAKAMLAEAQRFKLRYYELPVYNIKKSEIYRIVWISASKGGAQSIDEIIQLLEKTDENTLRTFIKVAKGTQRCLVTEGKTL